jgi:CMP-N,N'-diacetyllegionaminic acid synthase
MIALIPARGGSKGLPGKNIKMLNGKPLIAYTIEAALKSRHITRVIVSTDDEKIAEIAISYGAEVPFLRPEVLASDQAKSIDVFNYTINRLEDEGKMQINEIIILQPTSPLRNSNHINEAITMFTSKNADSVISYCAEHHPITWHKYLTKDGQFVNIFDDKLSNRQDERTSFFPNGAIYIYKKEILLSGKYYTKNSYAYVMEKKCSIDIDDMDDFEYCQYLMSRDA